MDPSEELEIEEVYKRGGKRRKAPKRKRRAKKRVDVGDFVYLIPGNAPRQYQTVRRLATPGQLYSDLPKVLRPQSYGSAPAAYRPMTQYEFVSAGDKMYGRGRNFYDDIMVNVNPSNIEPNKVPSKRLVPSSNKNTAPTVNQPIVSSLPFQGDTPAIHLTADRTPSVRAVSSQPSTGFISNQLGGVHYAVPSAAAAEQYESQEEQQAALESVAEARKPVRMKRPAVAKFNPLMDAPWDTIYGWRAYLPKARERFPTLNDLKQETQMTSYKAYIESLIDRVKDQFTDEATTRAYSGGGKDSLNDIVVTLLETMKRGGIRRRGRGGN